jgi:hypothetical protein
MVCHAQPSSYRCLDCHGMPITCMACCREMHMRNPLHRIEEWTGKYFIASWLWKVGICLDLGHYGRACPSYNDNSDFPQEHLSSLPDDEEDLEDYEWVNQAKPTLSHLNIPGSKVMVVVHTNGIHYLPVRICRCASCPTEDIQMMRMGYYPSTYKSIQTMFTFQLLDDYLLENLECQTSGHHYYQKLRRMSNNSAPQLVPVC